jgi:hypothetical protein
MSVPSLCRLDIFWIVVETSVEDIIYTCDDIGGATTDIKNSETFGRLYDIRNKSAKGLFTPD